MGRQYLHNPARSAILAELSALNLPLNIMEGQGNSRGAEAAGMRKGLSALEVLEKGLSDWPWDFLHVAGANPACKYSEWKDKRVNGLMGEIGIPYHKFLGDRR